MTRPLLTRAEIVEQRQQRRVAKTAQQVKRGVKGKNAARDGKRFPGGVIPELRDFTRHQPCLIAGVGDHVCRYSPKTDRASGQMFLGSDPAHVEPEARGAGDFDNLVPLCRRAHELQEGRNRWFEATFGQRLAAAARRNTAKWIREHCGSSRGGAGQ